ncbi:hypothetical protein [Brevibacillus dissolubilis]|uniref:hypothetical protein n=1 Tax=Brevibacillus dissolubilis TaxID=1844116 RepID=UPI001117832B|nr:hypothetical protein [Brevibacillus dissolubilis]
MSRQQIINDSAKERDGGYYAIKGFLYQFDVTIKEILVNVEKDVQFEQIQDINYEDYVIQIKHKETQEYSPSKIKKAIIQLLDIYKNDESKYLCLYCHFKDIVPQLKQLPITELDSILGSESGNYTELLKESFIKNFTIKFSHDYDTQFNEVIGLIQKTYKLPSIESSIYQHALIRSKLLELAINKEKSYRVINKANLDSFLQEVQKVNFSRGYLDFLSKEKYEKLVKKEFFTIGLNLLNFERLFIIDVDDNASDTDLLSIVGKLIKKYWRKDKSPAPVICFRYMSVSRINIIKQQLFDDRVNFCDGTFFNGDKFRLEKVMEKNFNYQVKFIDESNIPLLINNHFVHEIYHFYSLNIVNFNANKMKQIHIHVHEATQILKMI